MKTLIQRLATYMLLCAIVLLQSCQMYDEIMTDHTAKNKDQEDKQLADWYKKQEDSVKHPDTKSAGAVGTDVVRQLDVPQSEHVGPEIKPLELPPRPKDVTDKTPFYEAYLKKLPDKSMNVKIETDASIQDIVQVFAAALQFNYIIDPGVKSAVSIQINTELMPREIWQMFEQLLWLSGAYCSPDGKGILHILPFKKMPQERQVLSMHDPQANVEVRLVPIRNAASKTIMDKIKPFLTEGATAIDITRQNAVLLVEAPSNVPKLLGLMKLLDRKNKDGWPQAIVRCSNVSSTRIKNELAAILPVLGFPVTMDKAEVEPGAIHLISLDRLQVIVASAANEEALKELRNWARILDKSNVGDQEQVFVYKVVNGKADELIQALSAIFTVNSTTLSASTSGSSSSSASGASTGATTPAASSSRTSTTSSSSTVDTQEGPASVFDVPIRAFADAVQNRILIRTTPRTYAMVKAVLNRMDTAASQVLLQLVVSEVTLTEDTKFGLEFSDKQGDTGNKLNSLFGTNFEQLNPGSPDSEYGFKYHLTDFKNPDDKFAYLKALAGQGKIEILSSPQMVVQSHSQAKISVGDRVPIVTSENTDTSSGTTLNRSIQYEDTGIILTITPHVTKGGLITIELKQEVSDATKNTTSDIDSPVISERVLETSLAIRDGATLIVGGIIKEHKKDSVASVPLIINIPVIRNLFGYTDVELKRTEMVVLITGRIITSESKLEEMTRRYREAIKAIVDMDRESKKE